MKDEPRLSRIEMAAGQKLQQSDGRRRTNRLLVILEMVLVSSKTLERIQGSSACFRPAK